MLPWVPEVFSRVRRGASFPETAHEKPLAPRVAQCGQCIVSRVGIVRLEACDHTSC